MVSSLAILLLSPEEVDSAYSLPSLYPSTHFLLIVATSDSDSPLYSPLPPASDRLLCLPLYLHLSLLEFLHSIKSAQPFIRESGAQNFKYLVESIPQTLLNYQENNLPFQHMDQDTSAHLITLQMAANHLSLMNEMTAFFSRETCQLKNMTHFALKVTLEKTGLLSYYFPANLV